VTDPKDVSAAGVLLIVFFVLLFALGKVFDRRGKK
jgi:hypothetical protein